MKNLNPEPDFRLENYFHYNLNFTNLKHFSLENIKLQYQIKPKKIEI